jgi:hypothetical protein
VQYSAASKNFVVIAKSQMSHKAILARKKSCRKEMYFPLMGAKRIRSKTCGSGAAQDVQSGKNRAASGRSGGAAGTLDDVATTSWVAAN